MSATLKLISPVQLQLLVDIELHRVQYYKDEIVTVEASTGIRLVRGKKATQLGTVERARSLNDYVLVNAKGEVIPFTEHGTEAKTAAAPAKSETKAPASETAKDNQ